ncbi:MAG: hypothetical protein AUI61_01195 [Thaumarchaeota archaeon 13_1_40CM_2_39_13_2]|nr:MAG: hypothetical protein AUI61_01195 [Thaumarchaeota archaeon 13_1_40CM_2_39_13_2]OLE40313.1 MAG: hypothetical protein AUG16_04675 [Thaumarchaeota archaeon 13_1_20CM_2_39_20]
MILIENVKILFIRVKDSMMLPVLFSIWGCVPEISKECVDMTNAASTYLGIMVGAIIGSVVSWWIYYRQKKTSVKQDHILSRINELEENHGDILKKLADFDEKHESYFDAMQELKRKMDSILSKTDTDSSK